MPELNFRTVKLLRYVTPGDYFILACELIFVCFIFYYIVEEILEARKQKLEYFNSLWNFLDMIVIGVRTSIGNTTVLLSHVCDKSIANSSHLT